MTREQRTAKRLERWSEAVELVDRGGDLRPHLADCVALVREGFNMVEIAGRLGLSKSLVGQLLTDPTGEKVAARKAKVFGHCKDCGTKVTNSGSPNIPERCGPCFRARNQEKNERIVEAVKAGVPHKEIARREGMGETEVGSQLNQLRKRGWSVPMCHLPHTTYAERYERIAKLVRAGKTNAEIAVEVGAASGPSAAQMIKNARRKGYDIPRRRWIGEGPGRGHIEVLT